MKGRIDNLLGLPELGGHELSLSRFVGYQGALRLLESSSADEECPGEETVSIELVWDVCVIDSRSQLNVWCITFSRAVVPTPKPPSSIHACRNLTLDL